MPATPRWNAATLLTFSRLILAPCVVWEILQQHAPAALILIVIAGFTDLFDGALARATGTASEFGQLLDPVADKFLLSGVFVGLAWIGSVPLWFVVLVFGRDLLLLIASLTVILLKIPADLKPSVYGKLSTLFQIATAGVFVAANAASGAGPPGAILKDTANFLIWPTAAATLTSGLQYGIRGISKLRQRV